MFAVCLLFVLVAAGCASPNVEGGAAEPPPTGTPMSSPPRNTVPDLPTPPSVSTSTTLAFPEPPEAPSPGGFAAVSAGWGYTCGLRADLSVECWQWGGTGFQLDEDPWGGEVWWDLEWEEEHIGLKWDPSPQAAQPPTGEFTMISAGRESACGLRRTGRVECWGKNQALNNPPEGEFVTISASIEHACAIRHSGRTECWGNSTPRGNSTLSPDRQYTDVAAGDTFTCGIRRDDSTAECWGHRFTHNTDHPERGRGVIPPGEFATITAGGSHICGLRPNRSVACWANRSPEYPKYPEIPDFYSYLTPPPDEFVYISVGNGTACGLRPGGEHECWGVNGRVIQIPSGDYTIVNADNPLALCGVLRGGSVECWNPGIDPPTRFDIPGSVYTQFSSGYSNTCGLRTDGGLECWAWQEGHPAGDAPEGVFTSVSSGRDHACGVRIDRSVECWGIDLYRRTIPPQGEFTKVSASTYYTCGLNSDERIICWGEPFTQSKILPPQEPLISLSAGWGGYNWDYYGLGPHGELLSSGPLNDWGYSCGMRPDRTAKCWGDPGERLWRWAGDWVQVLEPPGGEFVEVQTGRLHACGLRDDGNIECWGHHPDRRFQHGYLRAGVYPESIRPDPGGYKAFSVGGTHTCGLRLDGYIECWDDSGRAVFYEKGPFTALSSGYDHQCGLLTTGNIHCWSKIKPDPTTWKTQTYTPTPN